MWKQIGDSTFEYRIRGLTLGRVYLYRGGWIRWETYAVVFNGGYIKFTIAHKGSIRGLDSAKLKVEEILETV